MSDKDMIAALILVIASLIDEPTGTFFERLQKHSNAECAGLIDQWVKSERGRTVLKRHLLDDITIEQIAEEVDRSPRQTARILKRAREELNTHMA